MQVPFVDVGLSRRLERTEGVGSARFVETRAELAPWSGAAWTEIGGALAMFDGATSPLTQTFGLGLFEPATDGVLSGLEAFFAERGAPVMHEVSPLAVPDTLARLTDRGYRPIELSSVMFRPIDRDLRVPGARHGAIRVQVVEPERGDVWARTATEGWREYGDVRELMQDVATVYGRRDDATLLLVELDGRPVAAGALVIGDGVAHLAGASTVPNARRHGAQRALLEYRLRFAAERGCDLAMMAARPGSASQRNAERNEFRIAYTRTKWELPAASGRTEAT